MNPNGVSQVTRTLPTLASLLALQICLPLIDTRGSHTRGLLSSGGT